MVAVGRARPPREDALNPRISTVIGLGVAVLIGLIAGVTGHRLHRAGSTHARSAEVATVFEEVRPSAVDLRVLGSSERLGAGVVVGPLEVITARHLVVDAEGPIRVHAWDGTVQDARLLGTDARSDLALLALVEPLRPAKLGSVRDLRIGDTVLAVGNPFGLGQSLSVGVVGAKGRKLTRGGAPQVGFIQLSIPLNPGNSGGPVFGLDGRLAGILTGTHTEGQGIGFAVPADAIVDALADLRAGRHLTRGFLGVRVADTDGGVTIVSTIPTGPADMAGLRPGDRIVGFDGVEIGDVRSFYERLDRLAGGERTTFHVYRDGALVIVDVELADWSEQPVVIAGMTLRPLAGAGGRVVAVRPRSRAARAGIRIGDVVRTVNGLPVRAPADVREAIGLERAAIMRVEREGRAVQIRL